MTLQAEIELGIANLKRLEALVDAAYYRGVGDGVMKRIALDAPLPEGYDERRALDRIIHGDLHVTGEITAGGDVVAMADDPTLGYVTNTDHLDIPDRGEYDGNPEHVKPHDGGRLSNGYDYVWDGDEPLPYDGGTDWMDDLAYPQML